MQLLDGKKVAEKIKAEIANEVICIAGAGGKIPHLAAILVGNDGGSESYVANKVKDCEQVGFVSTLIRLENNVSELELLNNISKLNNNPDIDGFIVQLPLPKHFSEQNIIEAIDPKKDVDGFHPINIGRTAIGLPSYISATPFGILQLLSYYKIETSGKNCVVIGRSNIVGRPMSVLLSQKGKDCTVTVCHSKTKNISFFTNQADIIIAAIGQPEFLKGNMVKEGAIVVDVGTTRVKSDSSKSGFKLIGDVAFEEVAPKCSFITPVPGGVGPMTRVGLLMNTLLAAKKSIYQ
jgi:methylenetetrahydrofolate dehydrogenase (NADP+)/methenyltetrahydrofolate cyclohydrolase